MMEKSIEFLQDMFPIDHQLIYDTYISKHENLDETISCLISICNVGTKCPPTYEEAMLNPSNLVSGSNENNKRKDSRRNLGKKEWKSPVVGKLTDDFLRVPIEISNNSASVGFLCKSCSMLKCKNTKNESNSPKAGPSHSSMSVSEIENIDSIIRRRMEDNVSQTRYASMRSKPNSGNMQYLDDERLALMLQNQEFLQMIQSDPEFQQALEEDHRAASSALTDKDIEDIWQEREGSVRFHPQDMDDLDYGYEQSDIVDPDNLWPQQPLHNSENDVTRMCRSMGKISRNRINALAKRFFSIRRRKSSKPYTNMSPIVPRDNQSNAEHWETESTQQLITSDEDSESWLDISSNYSNSMGSMRRTNSNSTLM